MKKLLCFFFICLIVLSIGGCGKDSVDYDAMPEEEATVRKAADKALTEKFGFDDFTYCKIEIENGAEDELQTVSYELEMFGYPTAEDYTVKLCTDGTVRSVDGENAGEYSCFISKVTEKDIKKAVKALDEKLGWGEDPDYFLQVDDNGDLYLKYYKEYEMYAMYPDRGCVLKINKVSREELVCKRP